MKSKFSPILRKIEQEKMQSNEDITLQNDTSYNEYTIEDLQRENENLEREQEDLLREQEDLLRELEDKEREQENLSLELIDLLKDNNKLLMSQLIEARRLIYLMNKVNKNRKYHNIAANEIISKEDLNKISSNLYLLKNEEDELFNGKIKIKDLVESGISAVVNYGFITEGYIVLDVINNAILNKLYDLIEVGEIVEDTLNIKFDTDERIENLERTLTNLREEISENILLEENDM